MLFGARRANSGRLSPRRSRAKDKESPSAKPWARSRANTGQLSRPNKNALEPRKARMRVGAGVRSRTGMAESEKDRLAHAVVERHRDFELALEGDRRSYPTREFRPFADAVQRHVRTIHGVELIHRDVVKAVHHLVKSSRRKLAESNLTYVVPGD